MRLTPTEGFAVLAAGKTLLAVPGAELGGALESALDKLETALGSVGSVSVELDAPPLLGVVRAAADEQHRLKVTHYSLRDEVTERVVDPWFVFSQEGRWYISGADSRSGEVRTFRIDRLVTAEPTGESFTRPPDARPPAHAFSAGPETTEVVLRLPGAARWVAEAYDALEVKELKDGELRIKLAVSGDRWLERLLLRVGPGASVVSPESFAGVGATAARRLLARYEG
jgi:proteasome accessory factor C